jgi:hypothetical protein
MSQTHLQVLLQNTFQNPEFAGFIEKPTENNEAQQIFGNITGEFLSPISDIPNLTYNILKKKKQVAGLVAKGANQFSTIGDEVIDTFSTGICRFGVERSYSAGDDEMVQNILSRINANGSLPISNFNLFSKYFENLNPIRLIETIQNTIDLQAWIGADGVEQVRRQEAISISTTIKSKVFGVLNNTRITNYLVDANGTATGDTEKRKWKNKSIDQIKSDLFYAFNKIDEKFFNEPDTLILSKNMFNYLNQKQIDSDNTLKITFLEAIKKAFPNVNIVAPRFMNNLKNSDGSNAIDNLGDRFIMFKKDNRNMGILSSTFEPHQSNDTFTKTTRIGYSARNAGLIVKNTDLIIIGNGIG